MRNIVKIVCGIILATMLGAGGSVVYLIATRHTINHTQNTEQTIVNQATQNATNVAPTITAIAPSVTAIAPTGSAIVSPCTTVSDTAASVAQTVSNIAPIVTNTVPEIASSVAKNDPTESKGIKKHHKYESIVVPTK